MSVNVQQRGSMRLSSVQRHAVINQDDHGVADLAPIFVMDRETWDLYAPVLFFNYFYPDTDKRSKARQKPVWQRYELLFPVEAKILCGIVERLDGEVRKILNTPSVADRYYKAYVEMSNLVDELDAYVDRDLKPNGRWNHGYVINDEIILDPADLPEEW